MWVFIHITIHPGTEIGPVSSNQLMDLMRSQTVHFQTKVRRDEETSHVSLGTRIRELELPSKHLHARTEGF